MIDPRLADSVTKCERGCVILAILPSNSRTDILTLRQSSDSRSHSLLDAGTQGNSTLVEFTLSPEGDGTRLRVVETGVEQLGWAAEQQQGFVEEHGSGWLTYLGRLSDLIARRPTGSTGHVR